MPSKYGFGNTRKKSPMPMYGKSQKNPVQLTAKGKEKIMASDANPKFKEAIANSPIEMYGAKKNSMLKKYKSAAQRMAVHASKAEKGSMAKMYGKSPMENDKEKKYAANKKFNDHAKSTGLIPNFKTREEKIKFYSNKSNVNKLNKAQKSFETNN